MKTTFMILQIVIAVLLIFIVLIQEGTDPGMRGIVGSSPDTSDSFFSKNGGATKKSFMTKLTTFLAILFLITTIALGILTAG